MNKQQKLIQLENIFIAHQIECPKDELEEFADIFQVKNYKKSDIIQDANSTEEIFGYITSGLVRFYFNTRDGKEFNQTFKCEHQIFSNYYATFVKEPSPIVIQALEETSALVTDFSKILPFFDKSRAWDRLGRKITERNFMYKAIREKDLLVNDAMTRLNNFKIHFPKLTNRVSKHHLALYLGINPASLSRLLKSST